MAKLIVITKGLPASTFELGNHWVTIGRAPTNQFQILEASVSGHHCEALLRGDELIIRDMRSTNGTFIKGAMVSEGSVLPGETFRLGEVELRFEKAPAIILPPKIYVPAPGTDKNHPAKPAAITPATGQKKHQVLLVDDSMAFLEALGEMFEVLSDRTWEIYRAATADQALAILQQHPIELAVLDINMPMLDGVQLLAVIQRRHPEVKKVVVTAHATEAYRTACLANGAELFLEKPIGSDGFVSVYNLLNDLFAWSQKEGFSGTLRQVGLTDVIQIECLRRSSCILEVHNPETFGMIYIESGGLVHATAGAFAGEKALFCLLGLRNGEFRMKPFLSPPVRTIQGTWEYLLMEAARLSDEARIARPGDETVIITKPVADAAKGVPPAPEKPAPQGVDSGFKELGEDIVVVSTYDGKWHPVDGSKR